MKTLTPTKHFLLSFLTVILSTFAAVAQSLPSKINTLTNTLTETGAKPTPCEASFTYDVYSNGSVFFVSTSTGDSFNCIWMFGDGPLGVVGPNQSHTYASAGTYHVWMMISGNSCFDTVSTDIFVPGSSGCNATFTYTEDSTRTFTFTPNWLKPGTTYHWTFDMSYTTSDTTPTYTFNQFQYHYICLAVSNDADSCWSEVCDTIVFTNPPPPDPCDASFDYLSVDSLVGMVFFTNTSMHGSAGVTYEWDFGDGGYSHLESPDHQFNSPGWFRVCVTMVSNDSMCIDTYCDSVYIEFPTGLKDDNTISISTIYPIPFTDELKLDVVLPGTGKVKVTIMDITGKAILEKEVTLHKETNTIIVNTTDLSKGIYFADIQSEYGHIVKKICK